MNHHKDNIEFSRDEDKFRALYLQHGPTLLFFAQKYVDNNTAEDIVHDVFIKIWKGKLETFSPNGNLSYLFRMVQNACYDYLKHKVIENNFLDNAYNELKIEELKWSDSENSLNLDEKIKNIYDVIDKLPPKCKEIFIKAYIEEEKYSVIADYYQISIRTVETQVYKALKFIRNNLIHLLIFIFL